MMKSQQTRYTVRAHSFLKYKKVLVILISVAFWRTTILVDNTRVHTYNKLGKHLKDKSIIFITLYV